MYVDLKVILKIGKVEEVMSQTIWVRKGNCMAPALFLCMVMDFSKKLEREWNKAELVKINMRQHSHSSRDKGRLMNQKRIKLL